jgi:two-component system LytT family response regulator
MTPTVLRLAIVDDEPLARQVLREYLAPMADVEVVAECANGFEAVKAVTELAPDLLLLDIQMPKLDGFEVLELVGRDVAVVFTTAYDEYALRAFDVHAVDYLLKPCGAERLRAALERARQRISQGALADTKALLELAQSRDGRPTRILVRDGAHVHVLPIEKIEYVQAQDDYVCFRMNGRDYLKEQTLASTEATLDPTHFVRIHRSYLLNVAWLSRVEQDARENAIAVLTNDVRLPVSRAGYARLTSRLP